MGKFLKVLGVLFGILIIFIGASVGWAYFSGRGLDEESKNWVVRIYLYTTGQKPTG